MKSATEYRYVGLRAHIQLWARMSKVRSLRTDVYKFSGEMRPGDTDLGSDGVTKGATAVPVCKGTL